MKLQRKFGLLLLSFFIMFSLMKSAAQGKKIVEKPLVQGLNVGDKAPSFNLKNVDGNILSSIDLKEAKGFIIIFTCNHCPFSLAYQDRIIELNDMFAANGYPVIAINPNDVTVSPEDSFDQMVARAAEKKYQFPYLYDENQSVAKSYGASRTPHVFVLKKNDAEMIVKYIGAIDDNADEPGKVTKKYVQDAVNALLSGKEVAISSTKAIGCTIKWKKVSK